MNVEGCWDTCNFEYASVQAFGRSGGLLSMWDNSLYKVKEMAKSRHYLITIGS